jgi:putative hydrolase of the HAD superfamily
MRATILNKVDTVIFDLDQTLLDKNQSLLNFADYQYEQFSLGRFIQDKQDYIGKFSELNNIIMPKEEVYEKLLDIFNIDISLYTELLDDLNNNFHVHSVGFPGHLQRLGRIKLP